jgi:hypothetical protein
MGESSNLSSNAFTFMDLFRPNRERVRRKKKDG